MIPTENSTRSNWPMQADRITSDGEAWEHKGLGIIANQELQGYQSEISSEINNQVGDHATTIIEFTIDGRPVRTKSPFIDLAMHPTCKIFRRNNTYDEKGELLLDKQSLNSVPGALCYHCDQYHAQLFFGLDETTMTPEKIRQRKESDIRLKTFYDDATGCHFEPRFHGKRLYLEYDCPLLGFRELAFPVLFEKRVVATFFVGQLTLEGREDFVHRMIGNVSERFPSCFKESRETANNIVEKMQREQKRRIKGKVGLEPHRIGVITEEKYNETINQAYKGVYSLEKRLTGAFSHTRHEYIRESFLKASQKIRPTQSLQLPQGQNTEDVVDDTPLTKLWNAFEESLGHLVENFSLRYALALGPSRIINVEQDFIKVQAKAGKWEEVFSKEALNHMKIDIHKPECVNDLRQLISKISVDSLCV